MSSLSAPAVAAIREEMRDAPRGSRSSTVARLASRFGVAEATVGRTVGSSGPRRSRPAARPEYRDWTRVAIAIANRAPQPVPLDLAIEAGVASGELPEEAAVMPVGTAYRVARELGLRRKPMHRRMSAEWPMQAVQIDASTSDRLFPVEELDGDWLLRLSNRPWKASGYKNKPLGPGRARLMLYALWDMCTGCVASTYVAARGESGLDALEAFCGLLAGDGSDPRRPMHGLPDDLWSDLGPLAKSDAARDLLRRLGVALITGEPYKSTRMGGVERTHRTRWSRFERTLYLRGEETILLSELNARLREFEARENETRLSRTPVAGRPCSRTAAWTALVRGRPEPLRQMPADPIETLAQEARRRVDVAGIVRWGGHQFEVEASAAARFAGQWVIARRSLSEAGSAETLALELEATGERALARLWAPRPYGDLRSAPATPLEVLRAKDAAAPGRPGADVFASRETATSSVVSMPVRTAPAEPLENRLSVDSHPDLASAMRAFADLCPWPLSAGQRQQVVAHLERQGLSRRAVTDLAARLMKAAAGGRG